MAILFQDYLQENQWDNRVDIFRLRLKEWWQNAPYVPTKVLHFVVLIKFSFTVESLNKNQKTNRKHI